MGRRIGAFTVGVLVWMLAGMAGFWLLRALWPSYAAVEPEYAFTPVMLLARLCVAVTCAIAAGTAIRVLMGRRSWMPWIVGAVLLAFMVPYHISIWDLFPVWYHVFFLSTLAPLIVLGAQLVSPSGKPDVFASRSGAD